MAVDHLGKTSDPEVPSEFAPDKALQALFERLQPRVFRGSRHLRSREAFAKGLFFVTPSIGRARAAVNFKVETSN
jgi:hypothetical protein